MLTQQILTEFEDFKFNLKCRSCDMREHWLSEPASERFLSFTVDLTSGAFARSCGGDVRGSKKASNSNMDKLTDNPADAPENLVSSATLSHGARLIYDKVKVLDMSQGVRLLASRLLNLALC